MNPQELIQLLLADDGYNTLKGHEQWIFQLLPELSVCKGFDQKNKWHVYDVYEHILRVVAGVEPNRVLRLAALFHDMGKPPAFTEDAEGVGHFYGHWDRSVEIFEKYEPMLGLVREEADLIRDTREGKFIYYDLNVSVLEEILLWVKDLKGENQDA